MPVSVRIKPIITFFSFFFILSAVNAQLVADAGPNHIICPGDSVQIGGVLPATGGLPPYTYLWSPSSGLTSTSVNHPFAFPSVGTTYTLSVTDDTGALSTDAITVGLKYISKVDAGSDITICRDNSYVIGSNYNIGGQGVSYLWSPNNSIDYDTLPRPTSAPLQTTTYTLVATMAGCSPKTSYVTVSILNTIIDAGPDITIDEGQTVTLMATGGFFYYWNPLPSLNNITTPNPDAEPVVTTTYYVWGEDYLHRCGRGDSVTVNVIKGDNVFFYNTITPNGDDVNDKWYIGNITKYPNNNVKIFNRNGQLVFRETGYANSWKGESFGNPLPAATYFYIVELGNETNDTYHGTVTIIR